MFRSADGRRVFLTLAVLPTAVGLALAWRRRLRLRRAALQGISRDVDWEQVQEHNSDWNHARSVLAARRGVPPPLIRDLRRDLAWRPFVHDDARCSYAYVLRVRDDGGDAHFSAEQLRGWFEALHPRRFEDAGDDGAAWTKVKRCGDSCLFLQFDFFVFSHGPQRWFVYFFHSL